MTDWSSFTPTDQSRKHRRALKKIYNPAILFKINVKFSCLIFNIVTFCKSVYDCFVFNSNQVFSSTKRQQRPSFKLESEGTRLISACRLVLTLSCTDLMFLLKI